MTIGIDQITPHPMNPRKDLGDLTELVESIRGFGVLQNLTVVPDDEDWESFTVVCGHRRLAAAKEAGLQKLPCSVVEMDMKTQISTMLMENMQRSDLTAQEEAQGFQMMLDMGGSIREIVEKTGLSETKVRHRIKLNELDQELLAKKMTGEISINDLIKLETLKDPEHKNKALEAIGTNNFDWTVRSLHTEEVKDYAIGRLKSMMPDVEYTANWTQYTQVCSMTYEEAAEDEKLNEFVEMVSEAAERTGCDILIKTGWDEIAGHIKRFPDSGQQKKEKDPEEARREKEQRERRSRLQSMSDRIGKSTTEFIQKTTEEKAKKLADKTMKYASLAMCAFNTEEKDVLELMGKMPDREEGAGYVKHLEAIQESYRKACEEEPYRTLLIGTFLSVSPANWNTWLYDGRYDEEEGEVAVELYAMLEGMGYEAADEELDFIHGRSDLYLKEE